ncbi:hypothetical protein ACQP1K_05225 [Sphaerimonospora sp. CA-214678]|uniref:hypothetical protein n=1 Tax=Sphaerimonospora sp. CA-214678 TaxID=3240029 RepID=UPI003D89EBB8
MVRKAGFDRVRTQIYGIDVITGTAGLDCTYTIAATTEEAVSGPRCRARPVSPQIRSVGMRSSAAEGLR